MKKYIALLPFIALAINAAAQAPFKKTSKGSLYEIYTPNAGTKIKMDDIVTFHVVQKTDKDSILFSSYANGSAMQVKVQPQGDLMDVLPLLTVKDSALVKMSVDTLFKGSEARIPAFLSKGSFVSFIIKIERVQSLDEAIAERKVLIESYAAKETADREKYIADKKMVLKTTPSGLKYNITVPSIKRKPIIGDSVWVNYTGRTLDGKVFDSSVEADAKKAGLNQPGRAYEPINFKLGTGMVIPGWDEGIALLGEGAKATFVIPSNLAYADRGAGEDIKPFNTLIFDVQLVKVKPAKKATVAKAGVKQTTAKKTTTVKKTTTTAAKKKS